MKKNFIELKPSMFINIAQELKQLIDITSRKIPPIEFSQDDWLSFLETQNFTSTICDTLCVTPRSSIPWEWVQNDENGKITVYLHYIQPERIQINEKYIRSPKLCGTFWTPISDINISFNETTRTTIIEFFPENKSNIKFPVLIKCGIDRNENSINDNIYFHSYENPTIPDIDLLSMFYLSLLSMPTSKHYFYIWASMAASQGDPNSQSYLGRVCLGDSRFDEAVHWFARSTIEHNYDPSALDLSILLIKYKIKPILAENLLFGLLKSGNDDAIVSLGTLYLNGCVQISSEISFSENPPQVQENCEVISEVKSDINKGLSLLKYEANEKNNQNAQRIINDYEKQHPFGEYNFSDVAISAGIVMSVLGGSLWVLSKFWKSRKK